MGYGIGGYGGGGFTGKLDFPTGPEWSRLAPEDERVRIFRRSNETSEGYRKGAAWFVYETDDRGRERAWELAPGAVLAWAPLQLRSC